MKNYEKWDIMVYPNTIVFGRGKYGGWYREAWEITKFNYDYTLNIIHHFYNHRENLATLTEDGWCRRCNRTISDAHRMFAELQLSGL